MAGAGEVEALVTGACEAGISEAEISEVGSCNAEACKAWACRDMQNWMRKSMGQQNIAQVQFSALLGLPRPLAHKRRAVYLEPRTH